jgi:uncharacterized protein (DUF3084 family)
LGEHHLAQPSSSSSSSASSSSINDDYGYFQDEEEEEEEVSVEAEIDLENLKKELEITMEEMEAVNKEWNEEQQNSITLNQQVFICVFELIFSFICC